MPTSGKSIVRSRLAGGSRAIVWANAARIAEDFAYVELA